MEYLQNDSPHNYETLNTNWIDQIKQSRNKVVLSSPSSLIYSEILHMYSEVYGDSVAILWILQLKKYQLLHR